LTAVVANLAQRYAVPAANPIYRRGRDDAKGKNKHVVDTSSAEFSEGLEAGLNSTADTINWQAGSELGRN